MEIDLEKARKKLDEIEAALIASDWKNDFGIYGGKCGYLIFLNELMRYKNAGEVYEQQMTEICETIFNDVQQEGVTTSFCSGLSGLVFTLNYLGLTELIDVEIFECIDLNAYDNTKRDVFDFIYGSTGMVYALSEAGYNKPAFYETWLQLIERKMGFFTDGLRLPVCYKGQAFSQNDYQYNNSLSHGMAAMLVVITGLLEKKQVDKKYDDLVKQIIDSILGMRNPAVTHEDGFYPSIIQMNNTRHYFKRISWCYGDLGIAIMLNRYRKYKGTSAYDDTITEILDHYMQYTSAEAIGVKDADFCHGAAGTALIYLFFYHESGDEKYRETANRWFNLMLEMDIYPDGAAGYKHFDPSGSYNDYGLLEGITGIGLTLVTFLTAGKRDWQTCFLMH